MDVDELSVGEGGCGSERSLSRWEETWSVLGITGDMGDKRPFVNGSWEVISEVEGKRMDPADER
jgi:hypothetical protein